MKKCITLIVGLCAFTYYVALSAKQYTWVFMSSDSGDWLACANWWMVPQPYGSPLYISLCRLIGLLPESQAVNLTILLSCLPSAITVMLIYLIVMKLTNKLWPAITSAFVLLGAGLFLTQSTVLEQYALAIMLCTLAYWFYVSDRRKLTALCLGLGTAVHIFVLPLAFFWFLLQWRERQLWLKPLAIYLCVGFLPYSLILILMYLDTPKLMTGHDIWYYISSTSGAVVGTLSVFDAPSRILSVVKVLLMSLGLALVPFWYGLKKPYDTKKLVLLTIVVVSLWYHLTSLDPSTWTFLCFGMPSLTVLIGIGLSKLTLRHVYIVTAGALTLILINAFFLNANVLTNERPLATTYYNELRSLPNGSVVVTTAGAYSLGLFYVMSEGKNLCPIVFPYTDEMEFPDYQEYIKEGWNIEGDSTEELTQDALDKGMDVYFAGSCNRYWRIAQAFEVDEGDPHYDRMINPIVRLSGLGPAPVGPIPK